MRPPRQDAHLPLALVGIGILSLWLGHYWTGVFRLQDVYGCGVKDFFDVYYYATTSRDALCTDLPKNYLAVRGLTVLGLLFVVVTLILCWRRGRRADRADDPWPLRRWVRRAAKRIDQALPGYDEELPRVGTPPLSALLLVVAVGLVGGVGFGWDAYQERRFDRHHAEARTALGQLALPSIFQASRPEAMGCFPDPDTRCVVSVAPTGRIITELTHLLHGEQPDDSPTCSSQPLFCSSIVFGELRGHPASAVISPRVLRSAGGPLPPGARPFHPGARPSPYFVLGWNISISVYPEPP